MAKPFTAEIAENLPECAKNSSGLIQLPWKGELGIAPLTALES